MDTHEADYLFCQEGRLLPVEHCLVGTRGWELVGPLAQIQVERNARVFRKSTFGSLTLARWLGEANAGEGVESIEFVGVCTDICVVSNVLLAKAQLPEVPIAVDASCCAGVTPELHEAALATMRSCQVAVI